MTSPLTTAQAASPEASREMAQRYQVDLLPFQTHGVTGSMSVETVPDLLPPWPDVRFILPSNVRAKLTFNIRLLANLFDTFSGHQSGAIGLRRMELNAEDVAELRRHREHPSAIPRLPLRRVPTEDVDYLD